MSHERMIRAVDTLNERMHAVGLAHGDRVGIDVTPEEKARLYVGLPVGHPEGRLLVESVSRDIIRQISEGRGVEVTIRGGLEMVLIAGILAGMEPDE